MYEFVKKGDAPVMGITKLDGITAEELMRPRKRLVDPSLSPEDGTIINATTPKKYLGALPSQMSSSWGRRGL
jgi:hypothetical protein